MPEAPERQTWSVGSLPGKYLSVKEGLVPHSISLSEGAVTFVNGVLLISFPLLFLSIQTNHWMTAFDHLE